MRTILLRLLSMVIFLSFARGAVFCEEKNPPKENTPAVKEEAQPAKEISIQKGEVNSDNINIRSDSTVSAPVICNIKKGEYVDIVSQVFDWYKIRLPRNAPSYVKKEFLAIIAEEEGGQPKENKAVVQVKHGQVTKDNVNVRLRPDINSPILGKVYKNETVKILQDAGDWYRIEPVKNSTGWIHKNFVDKLDSQKIKIIPKPRPEPEKAPEVILTVEGVIKAKTITKVATHKLITNDDKVFLLKGNPEEFSPLSRKKVKLTGKLLEPSDPANPPFIEVQKIEVLD